MVMQRVKNNKEIILLALIVFILLWVVSSEMKPAIGYVKAEVVKTRRAYRDAGKIIQPIETVVICRKFNNLILKVDNYIWPDKTQNTHIKAGDRLVLQIIEKDGLLQEASIVGHCKSPHLYVTGTVFLLIFLMIMGFRKAGILAAVLLNITIVVILLQLVRTGLFSFWAAALLCCCGAIVTIAMVFGGGEKYISASISAVAGLIFAGMLTAVFAEKMNLNSVFSLNSMMFYMPYCRFSGWNILDVKSIVPAGVMLVCFGSVVYIAVSIASVCWNFSASKKTVLPVSIWHCGMDAGKKIISILMNSITFVFIGALLPVIIAIELLKVPMLRVINYGFIATAILSFFIVGISLIVTVPVTAFVSSRIFKK